MPLFVYKCAVCGTQIEKLSRQPAESIPARIGNACPTCKKNTVFDRVPTAAALRTDRSHSSVTDSQRSSQRGSQERATRMKNIKRGLTGDGRQPTNLKEKSAKAWGDSFNQANPNLEKAREEIDNQRR